MYRQNVTYSCFYVPIIVCALHRLRPELINQRHLEIVRINQLKEKFGAVTVDAWADELIANNPEEFNKHANPLPFLNQFKTLGGMLYIEAQHQTRLFNKLCGNTHIALSTAIYNAIP